MKLRLALVLCALVTAAASWSIAASASSSAASPQFPPGFSAANLPATGVKSADSIAVDNLLGGMAGAGLGMSPESLTDARTIAETVKGALYFLPGANASCLAMTSAVSCLDAAVTSPLIALAVVDPATGYYVGGGVVASGVKSVTVSSSDGTTHTYSTGSGFFVIKPSDAMKPGGDALLHFSVNQ